ncbi:hypothetical protein MRB53_010406 [Persea americana]|uniref:Uncharacterized protein n=1 Tax=Persea americana TaxID=3435 RepID=A0ACC2LRV7_PERAE|nr:hypothetical protein MRB53_010406 [Persea americana]
MKLPVILVITILVLIGSSPAKARTAGPLSPSPAPAPASEYLNLTDLLTVAGPFHTFLNYLISTKVIDTFQNQANNTQQGLTIFVPKDKAFSSLKKPPLTNLTKEQLKSLLLFHALPKYYALADFENLSRSNPVNTYAGGSYTLNFTYTSGTIHISSGWADTKISSSVHSTVPVAVYQVDKVLLPQAIFGVPPPPSPTPAPAPAPDTTPTSDSASSPPSGDASSASSPKSESSTSSSYRVNFGILSYLVLVVLGALVLIL